MQTQQFDLAADDAVAGFRLQRLEVLNWGTFNHDVWHIEPDGHNTLLTGDIGSGKSTLVDAVTTLLVPHHRITYNKAAGAENKERTLYSYIRGEYKSEKDDTTQSAKAVALRDENSYTVLLGHFYNRGFDQRVTLAQVFWLKDQKHNPERYFVISETALSITEHFSGFGSDILNLKKQLRRMEHVTVLDNFKEYSNRFRHLFGINNEQALDLFYQTVSMKSVGNLTDFVRTHMLSKNEVDGRINELRCNFDNLNRAHEAVLKAKNQIDKLKPLVTDGERYKKLDSEIAELRKCRDALVSCFAAHKLELLDQHIDQLELDIQKTASRLELLKNEISYLREQESNLKTSIDDQGGGRLQKLEQDIARLEQERDRTRDTCKQYHEYAEVISLQKVRHEDDFYHNRQQADNLLREVEKIITALQNDSVDARIAIKEIDAQNKQINEELDSLKTRKTNIPLRNLTIRRELAETLGLDENELPFVGELLQIDESEGEWEGAVERVLHNFGLSLLVPEHLYATVSHYVDRTHLKGRLVYFKVQDKQESPKHYDQGPCSLVRKLRIKSDSEFYNWLEQELGRRFDYVCCDSIEDFRRFPRAITQNGQIKSAGQRHEKDDRRSVHDRRHYVLGWSNVNKIQTLETELLQLLQQKSQAESHFTSLEKKQQGLNTRRDNIRDLLKIKHFMEIHWQAIAQKIQTMEAEKNEIEKSSDVLQSLRSQLQATLTELHDKEEIRESLGGKQGGLVQQRKDRQAEREEAEQLILLLTEAEREAFFPEVTKYQQLALADKILTLKNLEKSQTAVRSYIQTQLDNSRSKLTGLTGSIIRQMQVYNDTYQAETNEVDASLDAVDDYSAMLTTLQTEDLPHHEDRFKQLLNEGTINSIALFQNQLDKERQEIREKIDTINISLGEIEYNSGTYIKLLLDKTQDVEVRDFQQDMKACLAHSLDDIDIYNETKFMQVKSIIDRFNGREGQVDQDRKWTRKVTDVRNWFVFSASERWKEDDTEKEFYSDSSGKSGGQKEKLAYTILASALAYQFGLEWGATQSRSFRFVVIDEAFGRGSDESTRYGLELFKKLNLQLLIVTPLQKIHIIEDYIRAVHFIDNEEGKNSVIRNLTVKEYKEEKLAYQQR
ncbi:MAG TPA: ATP-dependent exonuclease SbcCD, C subunit-like protein [Gammaproteobacteria bacterium]|nr:ATP-dependent exonuclease SbcCD, C subunit-like protein [Gammaproteobacteria bacterium]